MKPCRVLLSESVKTTLRRLAPIPKRTLRKALRELETDPFFGEPLEGKLADLHKLSVKNYRIIYKIVKEQKEIQVVAVGPRKTIYLDLLEILRLSEE